jgi:hypothetical protein
VRERGRERDCQQDGHALIQEILSKHGARRVTSSAGMPPPASVVAVAGMASLGADSPRADDQHVWLLSELLCFVPTDSPIVQASRAAYEALETSHLFKTFAIPSEKFSMAYIKRLVSFLQWKVFDHGLVETIIADVYSKIQVEVGTAGAQGTKDSRDASNKLYALPAGPRDRHRLRQTLAGFRKPAGIRSQDKKRKPSLVAICMDEKLKLPFADCCSRVRRDDLPPVRLRRDRAKHLRRLLRPCLGSGDGEEGG